MHPVTRREFLRGSALLAATTAAAACVQPAATPDPGAPLILSATPAHWFLPATAPSGETR